MNVLRVFLGNSRSKRRHVAAASCVQLGRCGSPVKPPGASMRRLRICCRGARSQSAGEHCESGLQLAGSPVAGPRAAPQCECRKRTRDSFPQEHGPLAGIRVLDLGQVSRGVGCSRGIQAGEAIHDPLAAAPRRSSRATSRARYWPISGRTSSRSRARRATSCARCVCATTWARRCGGAATTATSAA